MSTSSMDMGPQPLGTLLEQRDLKPSDLVGASTNHLTHKVVTKGCKGRQLTRKAQLKILEALNLLGDEETTYSLSDLFNYRGR